MGGYATSAMRLAVPVAAYRAGKIYGKNKRYSDVARQRAQRASLTGAGAGLYLSFTPAGRRKAVIGASTVTSAASGFALGATSVHREKAKSGTYYNRTVNGKVQRVKKGRRR